MPRERRIEYEGAVYHVMARGDRREDIVWNDADRKRFEETLKEVVERSGWVVLAWTLMSNHYHLLFKTPEPNLVAGMTWFQNTWTRRFNTYHGLWGHLFGGRYKAIPVEEGDYVTRLIHYIHLNPVRAGIVDRKKGIESHPWSTLSDYTNPPRKRRNWVAVAQGLELLDLEDTAAGRRVFLQNTEAQIDWSKPEEAGHENPEGQGLQSTLSRGWYFGTEAFREMLLEKLGTDDGALKEGRRRGYSGVQAHDHGQAEAKRIIGHATKLLALEPEDWVRMKKGDWRKGVVAGFIRRRALVDNGWIAEQLHMGARNAVSRTIRQAQEYARSDPEARRFASDLERMSKSFD